MSHSTAVPSGWYSARLSGWAMNRVAAAGTATAMPASRATRGEQPISRARSHVIGAASEPAIKNGMADASEVGPRSHIVGSWMIAASGIQWALLGIGKMGCAGIRPPTSTNDQMKSILKPCPAWRARATST